MADINQLISLGIGTPSSIKYYITFGLGIGEGAMPIVKGWTLFSRARTWTVDERDLDLSLYERDFSWTLDGDDR